VAAGKIDALADRGRLESLRAACAADGVPFAAISAVTGRGVRDLLERIWSLLDRGVAAAGGSHPA
jgi:hypothetical protein